MKQVTTTTVLLRLLLFLPLPQKMTILGNINYLSCMDCTTVVTDETTIPKDSLRNKQNDSLPVQQQEQQGRKVIVTNGAALALRFFELDSFRFMTDHATVSYEESMIQANLIIPTET
jgi:hypothetical protein